MHSLWKNKQKIAHKSISKIISTQQSRFLSLNENQSQKLLKEFGVPIPRGKVARTPTEAKKIIKEFGCTCTLKLQVPRGRSRFSQFDDRLEGGIYTVTDPEEANKVLAEIFGHQIKSDQAYRGELIEKNVYITEKVRFDQQWYLGLTIDREYYSPAIVLAKRGNTDTVKKATRHPAKIFTFNFGLSEGITPSLITRISSCLDASVQQSADVEKILNGMFRIFTEKDATLLEIDSLVQQSKDGALICSDAKFTIDNAAEKRQAELFALRASEFEITEEVEAEKYGLVYVRMSGNIGNVVNGAGLAMATNDAISLYGGSSANFLDAGGQATKETMLQAFRIIMNDNRVKAILVNIYGGITRCDMIAESIIGAANQLGPMRVPIVVRLQGTNSTEGLKLLETANLGLYVEAGFGEAAKKAVDLATS